MTLNTTVDTLLNQLLWSRLPWEWDPSQPFLRVELARGALSSALAKVMKPWW